MEKFRFCMQVLLLDSHRKAAFSQSKNKQVNPYSSHQKGKLLLCIYTQ